MKHYIRGSENIFRNRLGNSVTYYETWKKKYQRGIPNIYRQISKRNKIVKNYMYADKTTFKAPEIFSLIIAG